MDTKYYESHVTIEPVFGERLDRARELSALFGFKVADLLIKKREGDSPERSANDTFTTGRGKTFDDLHGRMRSLASALSHNGFQVWRVKIEAVVLDERTCAVYTSTGM